MRTLGLHNKTLMTKPKRYRLDPTRPVTKEELFLIITSDSDGAGLTARDFTHILGAHRNPSEYSQAKSGDLEDRIGRAILGRLLNAYTELLEPYKQPSYLEATELIAKYYPMIERDDLAVMIGTTKQSARRWKREKGEPQLLECVRLLRALKIIESLEGKQGVDYFIGVVVREYDLSGQETELSEAMLKVGRDILKSQAFKDYEDALFA